MRIEITRSGGFGGLTRTWSLEVSRTEAEQRWLPLAEAEAAGTDTGGPATGDDAAGGADTGDDAAGGTDTAGDALVERSSGEGHVDGSTGMGPGSRAGMPGAGVQRDRFTYRIAIGYTEVYVSENHLEAPWRELIERARSAGTPPALAGAASGAGSTDEVGRPPAVIVDDDVSRQVSGAEQSGDVGPGKPDELL